MFWRTAYEGRDRYGIPFPSPADIKLQKGCEAAKISLNKHNHSKTHWQVVNNVSRWKEYIKALFFIARKNFDLFFICCYCVIGSAVNPCHELLFVFFFAFISQNIHILKILSAQSDVANNIRIVQAWLMVPFSDMSLSPSLPLSLLLIKASLCH